jgi:hypothetical protein
LYPTAPRAYDFPVLREDEGAKTLTKGIVVLLLFAQEETLDAQHVALEILEEQFLVLPQFAFGKLCTY